MTPATTTELRTTSTATPSDVATDAPQTLSGLGVASMVMAIRSACRQDRIEEGVGDMRGAEADRQAEIDARLEAMRRASEATREGGFWSDIAGIAKTVGLVAAAVVGVAATVYTAGTSTVVAAMAVAALSAAPAVLPELATQVANATNASPEARLILQGVALAACIALAFWNPAGAVSGTAQAGEAMGRSVSTVTQMAEAVRNMGRIANAAAQIQSGYAQINQGLCTIEVGEHSADAQRCAARGTADEQRRDAALDRVEDAYREAARSARAIARMLDTNDQGAQAALRA